MNLEIVMPTIDMLNLALSCVALVSFAGLGVVALPWTRDELEASDRAWRTLFALPGHLIAAWNAASSTAPRHGPFVARALPAGRRVATR